MQDLSITSLDYNHPNVSLFSRDAVPVVDCSDDDSYKSGQSTDGLSGSRTCSCVPAQWVTKPDPHSSWAWRLPWDATFTTREIRDEECRRLSWCALNMVTYYASQCVAFNKEPPILYLNDPSNVSASGYLLVPLSSSTTHSLILTFISYRFSGRTCISMRSCFQGKLWSGCRQARASTAELLVISELRFRHHRRNLW